MCSLITDLQHAIFDYSPIADKINYFSPLIGSCIRCEAQFAFFLVLHRKGTQSVSVYSDFKHSYCRSCQSDGLESCLIFVYAHFDCAFHDCPLNYSHLDLVNFHIIKTDTLSFETFDTYFDTDFHCEHQIYQYIL